MDQVNVQHRDLAASGRWAEMSFAEQMANCGSEAYRALNWRKKGKPELAERAFERCLELLDFTVAAQLGNQDRPSGVRELLRLREVLCDFFAGGNEYGSTPESINRYFAFFSLRAAAERQAHRA